KAVISCGPDRAGCVFHQGKDPTRGNALTRGKVGDVAVAKPADSAGAESHPEASISRGKERQDGRAVEMRAAAGLVRSEAKTVKPVKPGFRPEPQVPILRLNDGPDRTRNAVFRGPCRVSQLGDRFRRVQR